MPSAATRARPRLAISSRIRSMRVSPATARAISTVASSARTDCSSSPRRSASALCSRAFSIAVAAQFASTIDVCSSTSSNASLVVASVT